MATLGRWRADQAVTLVTGASSGIGRCLCQLLLARGARVVAVARREERLRELAEQSDHDRFFPVVGDITAPQIRQTAVETAEKIADGRLDLLVNNAGIGGIGPFADASAERLRRIMEVNFFAPVELTRQALPLLRHGRLPVICNVGSVLGHRAVPDKSEYCASKFALHGWSDSVRAELAPAGIQVTLVSPSTTRSEFFDALIETEDAKSKSLGSWPPQRVARAALAAIQFRRSEVICSLAGKALVYADRIAPPIVNALLAKPAN